MGICPTLRGHANGSFPPGTASPNSRSAAAFPPSVPGYHISNNAGACSAAQFTSSGRAFISSTTTGLSDPNNSYSNS